MHFIYGYQDVKNYSLVLFKESSFSIYKVTNGSGKMIKDKEDI